MHNYSQIAVILCVENPSGKLSECGIENRPSIIYVHNSKSVDCTAFPTQSPEARTRSDLDDGQYRVLGFDGCDYAEFHG